MVYIFSLLHFISIQKTQFLILILNTLIERIIFFFMRKQQIVATILLVLLVSGSCSTISSTCCTQCPQYKVLPTKYTPNQFKNMVFNSIIINRPITQVNSTIGSFPMVYVSKLIGRLWDMRQRIQLGYASCERDVTSSPDYQSYTDMNEGYIDLLTKQVKKRSTIWTRQAPESKPYYSVFETLYDDIDKYFVDNPPSSIYSSNYFYPVDQDWPLKLVKMSINAIAFLRFGVYEQNFIAQEAQTSWEQCFDQINNGIDETCLTYPKDGTIPSVPVFDRFIPRKKVRVQRSQIGTIFYYWLNVYDEITQQQPEVFLTFHKYQFLAQQNTTATATNSSQEIEFIASDVSLQNRRAGEISIMDPAMLRLMLPLNFSGKPATVNASDPNGGYRPGETDYTIWADLTAMFTAPFLSCKYPQLLDQLLNSCPGTCDRSC